MIYVGADISKLKIDVYVNTNHQSLKNKSKFVSYKNSETGIEQLCSSLPQEAFVVFESTGPYSKLLYKILCDKKIACTCVNPYRTNSFFRSLGHSAKTDKIDAKGLALFGERMQPTKTTCGSDDEEKLKELVRAREAIIETIQMYKNRLDTPSFEETVNEVYDAIVKNLQQKLQEIKIKIEAFFQKNNEFAEKLELLKTIPGIGDITGSALLAYCPELGTLSASAAASLVGVAPRTKQSGTTYIKEHIGGGRKALRKVLYQSAIVSMRFDPECANLRKRLIEKGKVKKVAIVAVMRELFIRANSVLKRREEYEKRGELPPRTKKRAI